MHASSRSRCGQRHRGIAGRPNHAAMSWVDFAEGDLRAAREAKAELAKLLEQQKMLEFFLRKD